VRRSSHAWRGARGGPTLPPLGQAWIGERLALLEEIKQRNAAALEALPKPPITVTLPDGKAIEGKAWETSPLDIASGISKGLASATCVASARRLSGHGTAARAPSLSGRVFGGRSATPSATPGRCGSSTPMATSLRAGLPRRQSGRCGMCSGAARLRLPASLRQHVGLTARWVSSGLSRETASCDCTSGTSPPARRPSGALSPPPPRSVREGGARGQARLAV